MKRAWLVVALTVVPVFGLGPVSSAGGVPGGDGLLAFTMPSAPAESTARIATIRADGTELTVLDGVNSTSPSWSPDGTRIAFRGITAVPGEAAAVDVWVMDADGSDVHRVTRNARDDDCPTWSPDGTAIALFRSREDRRHSAQIRIKVLGVRGSTRITAQGYGGCPEWSPDGSTILFRTEPPGDDLYTIAPDGTALTLLLTDTDLGGLLMHPAWSPDGAKIALVGRGAGGREDIFVMNTDATGIVNITSSSEAWETHPAWSPSGDHIAYYPNNDELWTMASDGSDPSLVIAAPGLVFDLNSYPADWQPTPPALRTRAP